MPGELERAKHVLKGSILRNIGQPRDDMRMFAYHYMITGEVPLIDDEVRKYEAVTENQVMALAQQLLVRRDMTAAIYGAKNVAGSTAAFAKGVDF
jgi:predicted Zn-dependent peptidase